MGLRILGFTYCKSKKRKKATIKKGKKKTSKLQLLEGVGGQSREENANKELGSPVMAVL